MAVKRSPRYPRHSISKSLNMAEKLFKGAHQSLIDVDSAARVLGYTNSSSGAAASALGALRQYGLVDGLRGDMRVSDLAMRILQPMDAVEKAEALAEASMRPEIFGKVVAQFGGVLPPSDEPVRAYLIRQGGFSAGGAEELIDALRGTIAEVGALSSPSLSAINLDESEKEAGGALMASAAIQSASPAAASSSVLHAAPKDGGDAELIVLPLGANCRAELRFIGVVTELSYGRLIRHLELLKEALAE